MVSRCVFGVFKRASLKHVCVFGLFKRAFLKCAGLQIDTFLRARAR